MHKIKSKKQIFKEIYEEMPKGLNQKEIAAFIMMKIAKERSFSSQYYWGTSETREKMYKACVRNNNKKRENARQLICVTATKMYNEITEELGLDMYVVGDTKLTKDNYNIFETGEHISPVVKLESGKYIKTDIEWDIENIQTGRRWIKFGTIDKGQNDLTEIPEDELNSIMKKIGYINNENEYLENYIERLNLSDENQTIENRVNRLFSDKELTKRVLALKSSVDIYRFYRRATKEYITQNGEVTFHGGYAIGKKENSRKYTILAHLSEEDKHKFWVWSNRKRQMEPISENVLKQFVDNGMLHIVPGKKVQAHNNLMTAIDNSSLVEDIKSTEIDNIWSR